MVRVAADAWIEKLFEKIKYYEENPPEPIPVEEPAEPEEGAEPKEPEIPEVLTPLERAVADKLKAGGCPSEDEICSMLKDMIASPEAQTQGYVIDLDFAFHEKPNSWFKRFREFDILCGQELTHIVELMEDNYEIKLRSSNLWMTPNDGRVFSKWERDVRANRKKPVDEEGEPIEEDEEFLETVKPIPRDIAVIRVCDNEENVQNEITQYESPERPEVEDWLVKMYASTFIKIPASGLTPDEIAESVCYRLKTNVTEPVTPVAKIIEGGGDPAGLLSQDVNVDEGQLPRQYSLWRTTDPVSLTRGRVAPGQGEFAAFYANNVFLFENEQNMNDFVKTPRDFLNKAPAMPDDYRLLILGPRGAGVKQQAQNLNDKYGWRVVDFNKIVRDKLAEIMALPVKPPNNLTTVGPCMVCLSNEELQEIKDGKPFAAWKFLPWIMEFLGVPLMIKPPVEQKEEELDMSTWTEAQIKEHDKKMKKLAEEKKKKEKEEAEAKAAKEERARKRAEALEANPNVDLEEIGLAESEEEIKIDDLSIEQLIVQKDEQGNLPKIGQIVMYGFPQTELHITKMKEYGLVFDKIIYLTDTNEED